MDGFEFRFDDAHRFAEKMAQAPEIVGKEMTRTVDRLTIRGEGFAKRIAGSRTGHLRRNITHKPATFAGGVSRGAWGISLSSVPYARIHEEGRRGFSAPPGKVLRFVPKGSTKAIYRKRVGPAAGRWYMRKSMEQVRPFVRREFRDATRNIIIQIVGR